MRGLPGEENMPTTPQLPAIPGCTPLGLPEDRGAVYGLTLVLDARSNYGANMLMQIARRGM